MKYFDIIPPSFEICQILGNSKTPEEASKRIDKLKNIKDGNVIFLEKTRGCYYLFNGKQKVITLKKRTIGNRLKMTLWFRMF